MTLPAGPDSVPDVRFRMLTTGSDLERLVSGFGTACELMGNPAVRAVRHEVFAAG